MQGYVKLTVFFLIIGGFVFFILKNNNESEMYKDMKSNNIINRNNISATRIDKDESPLPVNPNLEVKFDESKLEEIWLAGGCFWGVEAYMERIYGVYDVTSGYANGKIENPTYNDVLSGSGHAETVHVRYDPNLVSLKELLNMFFKVVDPTSINKQGNDVGVSYRSGIYYKNEKDVKMIYEVINELAKIHGSDIVVEVKPLEHYYLAEEYHQDYLYKNPNGYCHIKFDAIEEQNLSKQNNKYKKPDDAIIKEKLTDLQYKVTQKNGTEPSFNNQYWDNKKEGIYVDIVSGEPLFSSNAKYDSKTGWPSFYEPIGQEFIKTRVDKSLFTTRVEVKSRYGDSHLGHVFEDGPINNGGLRYCINSAALEFIPIEEMELKGYGEWINKVE